MVRVWFNHWFSTSYRLISLMKQDEEEELYVIGTNLEPHSIIQKVCDEWYAEPRLDGEEYIDYCTAFCKEHNIDVFVPRRNMAEISKNIQRFHDIKVKVMVDDYDMIKLLGDKADTYAFFKDCAQIYIPDYYKVNTAAAFEQAYEALKSKYRQVCVKFVKDEGGMSFRKITQCADRFQRLRVYQGSEILYDEYIEILQSQESFDDLMVMPYLAGNEISVDCLNTEQGLIAIPRDKGAARHERVFYDEKLLDMVKAVMEKVKLEYPCNIQFKYMEDIPYLLEINTRMSGGLQMGCMAANVNIPNIAFNKLLGKSVMWKQQKKELFVSYIEIPDIVK